MPAKKDPVLVLTDRIALTEASSLSGDPAVAYTDELARGKSNLPAIGDAVVLPTDSFAQGAAGTFDSGKIIESFEAGDLSYYSGNTAEPTVVQPSAVTPQHGDNVLKWKSLTHDDGTIDTQQITIDRPARWRWDLYKDGSKDASMLFAVQNSPSGYKSGSKYIVSNRSKTNNALRLIKYTNGNETVIASGDNRSPENEWISHYISWEDDGFISVDVYNEDGSKVDTISGWDDTFATGGIGWRSDDPENYGYYDFARYE